MTYRNTYAEINLNNIKYNVKEIIKKYNNYKYYIGVVKADSYEHNSEQVVKAIIDGGCNCLAVSSLDEALIVRKYTNIPILFLGIIDNKYLNICEENNIDITITNINQLKNINKYKLNIHIKIDTVMNRLGVKTKDELIGIVSIGYADGIDRKMTGAYVYINNKKYKIVGNI